MNEQIPSRDAGWGERWARAVWWLPGLVVALCAAAATAHGLYEVARVSGTPTVIAMLYPVITDGLALVAYTATARLSGSGRRYAWAVVVLAAGLSGIAQAINLAGATPAGTVALRVVIGAWPAIAAAIVAHLLFLLATDHRAAPVVETLDTSPLPVDAGRTAARADRVQSSSVQAPILQRSGVQTPLVRREPDPPSDGDAVNGPARPDEAIGQDTAPVSEGRSSFSASAEPTARVRADEAARAHWARHGELPTVTRLMALAEVSRGTAGEALKPLRQHPISLHLITDSETSEAHS